MRVRSPVYRDLSQDRDAWLARVPRFAPVGRVAGGASDGGVVGQLLQAGFPLRALRVDRIAVRRIIRQIGVPAGSVTHAHRVTLRALQPPEQNRTEVVVLS